MLSKRGSTLAEMVIVLAIVSIMTVMVVSFTILANGWVHVGIQRYNLTTSEQSAANVVDEFVSLFDNEDYYFVSTDTTLSALSHSDPLFVHTLYFDTVRSVLTYTAPGQLQPSAYPLDCITKANFFVLNSEITGRQLIRCSLEYKIDVISSSAKAQTGTFIVSATSRTTAGDLP